MEVRDPWIGRAIGSLSLACAARPRTALGIILVLTMGIGAGMVHLETDADLIKILPKDHPTTAAALNASEEYRGFYDFVTFFYAIDEEKCQAAEERLPNRIEDDDMDVGCDNVLHEAYVRGMDEIWMFFQERIPEARYAIDFASLVKVVNWTNDGYFGDDPDQAILQPLIDGDPERVGRPPDDEAYSMPGTDPAGAAQYYAAYRGALAADDSATDTVARDLKAGRTLIFFDSEAATSRVALGQAVYAAVDAYEDAIRACDDGQECPLRWNVFSADGLAVRGVSTLDAHSSEVTQRDISILAPIIIWAIIAILYAAFRQPRVILVAAANLFIAFVWTAGLMGWLDIPFSALNMTIVPLILGVGIDYGIHMVSEFLEHKADGFTNTQAFQEAGNRAGLAMAIATITTVVGLLIMVASPSILMAQLGIVSSIALVVTFLFTVTLIPAVLTLTAREASPIPHKGSRLIVGLAGRVQRHRAIVVAIIIVGSGASLWGMQNLEAEAFGNPEMNYPKGDRVRDDADWINEVFLGQSSTAQTNYFIVEGDLTDPDTHVFLDTLEKNLEEDEEVQGFNTATLTRVVRGWIAVNQGTPKALANQFVLSQGPDEVRDLEYPQNSAEMRALYDDIFASPMANFMTILLNQDYDMGVVTFDTDQGAGFDEAKRVWLAAQRVVEETRAETGISEEQLNVQLFGNNAFSYLFITEEQPWVNTVGIVSFVLVIGLIAVLTRNLRATAAVATVMGLTSLWWLGSLGAMGIGLSVGLMLPMVFIMAIGSDDAIHLIWNMERTQDRRRVYRFVGQAVLLTTITTFVAFGIFSRQTDLLVTRTLLATSVAVIQMWLATMLVVPLFYPPNHAQDPHGHGPDQPNGVRKPIDADKSHMLVAQR